MAGKTRRGFGRIEKRPGGKYRVGFVGPDGQVHRPEHYFTNKGVAESWLAQEHALVEAAKRPHADPWISPSDRVEMRRRKTDGLPALLTLAEFAPGYLDGRTVKGGPLKPRTRAEYDRLLDAYILPTFGDRALVSIERRDIRAWLDGEMFRREGPDAPPMRTTRARAYDLLRAMLREAVADGLIPMSPATIKGAGETHTTREPVALTLDQVAALADAMPEHLSAAVLIAARCGLRQGELFGLHRDDIVGLDGDDPKIRVRRSISRVKGRLFVGTTKTTAGVRTVPIPRSIAAAVRTHLETYAGPESDAVVFPAKRGRYMAPASLYGRPATADRAGYGFYEARRVAEVEGMSWHHLRHTFATLMAQVPGMSPPTLQYLAGWTSPAMVMRYAHYMDATGRALVDAVDR